MKAISDTLIDVLEYVAHSKNINFGNKEYFFESQFKVVENDRSEMLRFLILFIENHEKWLVETDCGKKECCFDYSFEGTLEKLNPSEVNKLLEAIENTIDKNNNLPYQTLLLEAARFSYIELTREIKEIQSRKGYSRRINPEIKEVFEIHFPDSYQSNIDIRSDRMLFLDWIREGFTPELGDTKFGGTIEGLESTGINRIITLDPIPLMLNIESIKKLTIGINFEKAFWTLIELGTPYFVQHNIQGEPTKELNAIEKSKIQFYRENPLKECLVSLKSTPKKFIHHSNSKNEWRIGGMPNWVQEPEKVICPECKLNMDFIIQLPSGDLKDINGEGVYYGGDGGTTYGFWCDKDQIMGYIWQDT